MGTRRLLLAAGVACALAVPAAAQSKKQQRYYQRLERKLKCPAEALLAVHAERALSKKRVEREALLIAIGRQPDGRLLRLVLQLALEDREPSVRRAATRLLSVVGLEAERAELHRLLLPRLKVLYGDSYDEVFLGAMEEANRLMLWFEFEHERVRQLERLYEGDNYRLAQQAFCGIMDLQYPALRQKLADEVLREVLHPKTRFSIFERQRACLEVGRRGGPYTANQLADMIFDDNGTTAIQCAEALGQLKDPAGIVRLREVDTTASHKLRIPAYQARAALGDEQLFTEIERLVAKDHKNIQLAVLQALAEHPSQHTDSVLEQLQRKLVDDELVLEVAISRLRRGDEGGLARVKQELDEEGVKDAFKNRLVDELQHPVAAPIWLRFALDSEASGRNRGRAVDLLGEHGLGDQSARLAELAEGVKQVLAGPPSSLRLRSAATLLQLEVEDAAKALQKSLQDLNVVRREDADLGLGKKEKMGRRYAGSVLVDVCQRFARGQTAAAVPLMAEWLNPPERDADDADDGEGGEQAAGKDGEAPGGTRTRDDEGGRSGKSGQGQGEPSGPEFEPWMRHQFVRVGVIEALVDLLEALPADDPGRPAAIAALEQRLEDERGVVRRAAIRGLARLSRSGTLLPGADLDEEVKLLKAVRAWLQQRRAG